MNPHMHHVDRTAIADLMPTHLTAGDREVAAKRAASDATAKLARRQFMDGPGVPGPWARPPSSGPSAVGR
jgi:hypothetical protein